MNMLVFLLKPSDVPEVVIGLVTNEVAVWNVYDVTEKPNASRLTRQPTSSRFTNPLAGGADFKSAIHLRTSFPA